MVSFAFFLLYGNEAMEKKEGSGDVFVFVHRIEECGAESLVSKERLPFSDHEGKEITCRKCRKSENVQRPDAQRSFESKRRATA